MIGLILTTYNQLEDTKQAIESLEQTTQIPYSLVIVDNASNDETVSYIRKKGYPIIGNEQQICLSAALNQGLRYFLSNPAMQYIGWIHNDMRFYSNWLERLINLLKTNYKIGKLAPTSLNQFGPDDSVFAEQFMEQNKNLLHPGNACPWIIPRIVIEKVGLFDERFIKCGGYEDWDYNNRILEQGYDVMITKESAVWHPSMGTRKNHDELESARKNAHVYFQKWGTYNAKV
ncbi:glycosyltransferase family 2 protein [Priestia abyssalis]|uniref:glycosyltransferase family 2 protein n=1 Tax=Priestia abyssalis TaxID=1221450 RepID=UPI000994A038|nr:glycosyltransferase [Priestia abyssalis]